MIKRGSCQDFETFINTVPSPILIILTIFRYVGNRRFINVDREYRTEYQLLITKPVTFCKRAVR